MSQKKLMILGASRLQLPAIMEAKNMGLYTIVIDINKNAIGVDYADEFYRISTIDINNIIKKAEELKIDGIMTLATDMPMRSVAAVGEKLGLNTISYETAIRATDKVEMRKCLLENNVPVPFFYSIGTYNEFKEAVNSFKEDLIVKPVNSSGSRGVYLLHGRNNLKSIYNYSRSFSKNGKVLVEEYMKGPEVSVETITINRITYIIAITDKLTNGAPYFVEMGHSIQSLLPDNVKDDIKNVAKAAIAAIGINNSSAHTEIIVTDKGAKIVELGSRLGGDNITTSLVPLSTGVNMVKSCIELALGRIPDINRKFNKGSAIRFFNSGEGILRKVEGIENVRNRPGICEINITKSIGEKIEEIKSSVNRIGYVIAQSDSVQDAMDICQKTLGEINIIVD